MTTAIVIITGKHQERKWFRSFKEAMKNAREIKDQTGMKIYIENKLGDIIAEV